MDDDYTAHMMELCLSLGASKYHGHTHCEEESLLYYQLCRTLTKKAKIDEMAIDASMEDIERKIKEPVDDDDVQPPGVPA